MKKFLSIVFEFKQTACMFFAGTLLVFCIIRWILGESSLELSTILWLSCLSVVGTFLQMFCFSDVFFKKIKYTLRIAMSLILFAALFVSAALLLNWFPADSTISWVIFISVFIGVFIILTIAFEMYFAFVGRRYDGLLGQYKKNLDEKKQ